MGQCAHGFLDISEPKSSTFCVGYRSYEVGFADIELTTPTTHITPAPQLTTVLRPVIAISLGPHIAGAVPPAPDPKEPKTSLEGFKARVGRDLPPPNIDKQKLGDFVDMFCQEKLVPIPVLEDVSIERWLSRTHYPEWRKAQLRLAFNAVSVPGWKEYHHIKGHIKREFYMSYKQARGINARGDWSKARFGPYAKLMEDAVFSLPDFVKHIPIVDRPQYIKDRLGTQGPFYVTDYTAFESHMVKEIMELIECKIYAYLLQNFPGVAKEYENCLTGMNCISLNGNKLKVRGRRMSGDMVTSLGNGLTNMVMAHYLAYLNDSTITGVFEGDDGLFVVHGQWKPKVEEYKQNGFNIKIDAVDSFGAASFCGIICDEEALESIADPYRRLARFGWTLSPCMWGLKNHKGLLKAKAMSLGCELPHCPMFWALAKRTYEELQGVECIWHECDFWESELRRLTKNSPFSPARPHIRTRMLFQDMFEISVAEQIDFENYILTREDWRGPIPLRFFPHLASRCPDMIHFNDHYVYSTAGKIPRSL